MRKSFFALILALLSFTFVNAQPGSMGWLATFNTFKTGKKTSIHNDIQVRSADEWKQVQSLLFRTGLNFHLSKSITITGGYAYISNKRRIGPVSGFAPEHRAWEQLVISHKHKSLSISHRFRFEQRFISKSIVAGNELQSDGHSYANRFRYFIRNVIPVNNQATFSKGFFAALQNEVFINFGDNSAVNNEVFDQNRFYLAMGYRLSKSLDLEAGYLNQYINGSGKTFTNNHILQLAGYVRL
jgi:hypothetical protein